MTFANAYKEARTRNQRAETHGKDGVFHGNGRYKSAVLVSRMQK